MPSRTLRPDAGRPEPGIDGGNPAEAAARKRIAQARAWQWWAALRGDLCEHRSAAAVPGPVPPAAPLQATGPQSALEAGR